MRKINTLFPVVLIFGFHLGCSTCDPDRSDIDLWYRDQQVIADGIEVQLRDLMKQARDTKVTAPFFWEITKNGKSSWLLGTMHAGLSFGSLPIRIRNQLNAANTVVLESDDKSANQASVAFNLSPELKRKTTLPAGENLQGLISKNAWRILKWDLRPFPVDALQHLTPSAANSAYIAMRSMILLPPGWCMDCEIHHEARSKKKTLAYLETYPEVLKALGNMNTEESAKAMTPDDLDAFLTGKPLGAIKENIAANFRAAIQYKSGDISAIEKKMNSDASVYKAIIADRNEAWMPKLESLASAGNAFIAVGVGHMTGASSLIEKLRAKGFQVQRWVP